MQNSIWKLTALAGVIGATCLVVLLLKQNASEVPLVVSQVDPAAVLGESQAPPANLGNERTSVPDQFEPGQPTAEPDAFQPFPADQDTTAEGGIDFREPTAPPAADQPVVADPVETAANQFPNTPAEQPEFAPVGADTTDPSEANPFELVGATSDASRPSANTGDQPSARPPIEIDTTAASDAAGPVLLANDEVLTDDKQQEPPGLIFQSAEDRPATPTVQPENSAKQAPAFADDATSVPTTATTDGPDPFDADPLPIPTDESSTTPQQPAAEDFQPFAEGEPDLSAAASEAADPDSTPPQPAFENPPAAEPTSNQQPIQPTEDFPTLDLFETDETESGPSLTGDDSQDSSPQTQPVPLPAVEPDRGPSIGSPAPVAGSTPQPLSPPTDAQPATSAANDAILGDGTVAQETAEKTLRPQLRIEKKAPPKAVLGQPLIYHILVNNVGTTTASDVVVEDRIPKGTKLTGTIPRAELVDGRLVWRLGKLEPGRQSKISVRVIPIEEGQIGSVATVTSVAEVATRTEIVAPKLKVDVSSNDRVRVGDSIVCNFTITNESDVEATDVWIRNLIPEGLKHPDGQDLEHKIGRLGPGGTYEVQLTLQAVKAGQRINEVTVTANGGIRVNTKSVIDVQPNRLVLARSGPAKRYVGRVALYENRVTNKSAERVTNTKIVEKLPEGMDFVEASHSGTFNPNNRTVSWDFDQLDPRESRTVQLKLLPQNIGKKTSVVQVIEAAGGKSQTVSHTQVTGFASLGLDVSEVNRPMAVGEQVRLTVRTRNRGTSNATNVQVRFRLPTEFELLEVTAEKRPVKFTRVGDLIKLAPIAQLPGHSQSDFEVLLRARAAARTRLRFEIIADELSQALGRDEAILIFQDQQ